MLSTTIPGNGTLHTPSPSKRVISPARTALPDWFPKDPMQHDFMLVLQELRKSWVGLSPSQKDDLELLFPGIGNFLNAKESFGHFLMDDGKTLNAREINFVHSCLDKLQQELESRATQPKSSDDSKPNTALLDALITLKAQLHTSHGRDRQTVRLGLATLFLFAAAIVTALLTSTGLYVLPAAVLLSLLAAVVIGVSVTVGASWRFHHTSSAIREKSTQALRASFEAAVRNHTPAGAGPTTQEQLKQAYAALLGPLRRSFYFDDKAELTLSSNSIADTEPTLEEHGHNHVEHQLDDLFELGLNPMTPGFDAWHEAQLLYILQKFLKVDGIATYRKTV